MHLHLVSVSQLPDSRIGSNASTEHCHFYACPTESDNSLFKEVNGATTSMLCVILKHCFFFPPVNLLDYWDYSQNVGAKYSSSWKILLLQYKHYTAVIKTNNLFWNWSENKHCLESQKKKIYGPYLKEKYHTTVYYLKYMTSPHTTLFM